MNGWLYWKNRLPFIVTNGVGLLVLCLYLWLCGVGGSNIALIAMVWLLVLTIGLGATFYVKKRRLDHLLRLAERLPERYVLAEVMPSSQQAEAQVYERLLQMAGRSMMETVGAARRERAAYKESIEQWVHEVKAPLTTMKLLCEQAAADRKALLVEIEKINRFTEQALFAARSEHPEKDYLVRPLCVTDVIHQAVSDNKYLLRQAAVQLEVPESEAVVMADEKWLRFILSQLLVNAVQYRSTAPMICFAIAEQDEAVVLSVTDNGIGISAADLPRIFDKGFTGANGRKRGTATGMGLYLCKRLCDQLDIGLRVVSSEAGTTFSLSFHYNSYIVQVPGD